MASAVSPKAVFIAAAAVAVLTTAPVITPANAQGVDVQLGRDRDRDMIADLVASASARDSAVVW
jgi:hypothetical protein